MNSIQRARQEYIELFLFHNHARINIYVDKDK